MVFGPDLIFLSQTSELSRRIREAERDVKSLVADELTSTEEDKRNSTNDVENQERRQHNYIQDGGSDDDLSDGEGEDESDHSYDALEERFHGLEEAVAILVADVHDLALYTKLNITGFMKILKVIYCGSKFFMPCSFDFFLDPRNTM